MANQNYIRALGVYRAKLKSAIARGQKGDSKPACYIDFETKDGAIASCRLGNPFKHQDFSTMADLLIALGRPIRYDKARKIPQDKWLEEILKHVGKELNVLVAPNRWKDKVLWNVRGFWSPEFEPATSLVHNTASGGADPFGDDPFGGDQSPGDDSDPFATDDPF